MMAVECCRLVDECNALEREFEAEKSLLRKKLQAEKEAKEKAINHYSLHLV